MEGDENQSVEKIFVVTIVWVKRTMLMVRSTRAHACLSLEPILNLTLFFISDNHGAASVI